jgi:hypothetical protein
VADQFRDAERRRGKIPGRQVEGAAISRRNGGSNLSAGVWVLAFSSGP